MTGNPRMENSVTDRKEKDIVNSQISRKSLLIIGS